MLLNDEERERFAVYLEGEAKSDLEIADQLEKMGQPSGAQKYRVEGMAAQVIAKKLRSIESQTVNR